MLKSALMKEIYFLSHPNVCIDPKISITKWKLSELGKEKIIKIFDNDWILNIQDIYSSNETKAQETAKIISHKLGLKYTSLDDLGEIDRSSTGYLKLKDFMKAVNEFFTYPERSYRGWEKAIEAQKRIRNVVYNNIIKNSKANNILIVSHGGVGALLLADLLGTNISNKYDQKSQGSYFIFTENHKLIQNWIKL